MTLADELRALAEEFSVRALSSRADQVRALADRAEAMEAELSALRAAPVSEERPTITVSGPIACGKSAVMEIIYRALRDAGLHPFSDQLAHERRMVEEQPRPSETAWELVESTRLLRAPQQQAEPVAVVDPLALQKHRIKLDWYTEAKRIEFGILDREWQNDDDRHAKLVADVCFAIREAVEAAVPQQQGEPVAWQIKVAGVWANCPSEPEWEPGIEVRALYAAPPPDSEAVALLDDLVRQIDAFAEREGEADFYTGDARKFLSRKDQR